MLWCQRERVAEPDSTFPNWPEFRRLFTYDDLIGKVVQGRYEIVRRLGAGGMGVVFLARHVHLDKAFALKIISPRFLDEPEISHRFLQEARAASRIDHPNVVNITDFGPPEEGPAFFAMEYLEGEDLSRMLAREGPLPLPRALAIAAQIARALAAAHRCGVVHRDIKPQNCLRIARDGDPDFIKVLDFGLAKVLSGTGKNTWTVGGSPGYIAPEIYRGGRTDHRVDIYALGVVVHTLVLGRLPAQTASDVDLPPGAPLLRLGDLPEPVRALITRATADDPEQRFPTAEAMLAAIESARAALAGPVHTGMSPSTSRVTRWLVALTATGALVTAVALATTRSDRDPPASAEPDPARSDPAPPATPQPDPARADSVPSPREQLAPVAEQPAPTSPPTEQPSTPSPSAERPTPSSPTEQPASSPDPATMPPETGPSKPVRQATPRPPFDEPAARALLQKNSGKLRACKAGSTFRNVETTVRLTGTVTVTPRGRATLAMPPGYDINACLERVVAGLRFQPSDLGGSFDYTFLL